jgi:tetratricopeptide (TPR) repeat protein
MDRLEDAVGFYRGAADIYVTLNDLAKEGLARNNLADTLIKLKRFDEARTELKRAITCKEALGHAAEPWKTWDILWDLERAEGRGEAAGEAYAKARAAFLAYRRQGGENHTVQAQLCRLVGAALDSGETAEAAQTLDQYNGQELPPEAKLLLTGLRAILAGERNPTWPMTPTWITTMPSNSSFYWRPWPIPLDQQPLILGCISGGPIRGCHSTRIPVS